MISLGFPRMHKEQNEKEIFYLILEWWKVKKQILVEQGYGSAMGISEDEYLKANERKICFK